MSQAKARPSSMFESKSSRLASSSLRHVEIQKNLPGPGSYKINRELDSVKNSNNHTNNRKIFINSEERFKDLHSNTDLDQSNQELLNYLSDFDQLKLKILKKKKMTNKSLWVNDVGFVSTSKRFIDNPSVPSSAIDASVIPTSSATMINTNRSMTPYSAPTGLNKKYFSSEGHGNYNSSPSPSAYSTDAFNKTDSYNINYDNILKSSNKVYKELLDDKHKKKFASFGSNSKRFVSKNEKNSFTNPHQQKEAEINHEIQQYFQQKQGRNSLSEDSQTKKNKKPLNFNVFSPLPEKRLKPVKESLVPAPGSYNITPKWNDAHVPIMIPKINSENDRKNNK